MTNDQVMQLAHKAGMVEWFNSDNIDYISYKNAFFKFAELVAQKERCKNLEVMQQALSALESTATDPQEQGYAIQFRREEKAINALKKGIESE